MRLSFLPVAGLLFFAVQIASAQSLSSPQFLTMTTGDNSAHAASDAFVNTAVSGETSRAVGAEGALSNGLAVTTATANAALPNTPAALGSTYAAWFSTLPTTLPSTAGAYWNNGGMLSKS